MMHKKRIKSSESCEGGKPWLRWFIVGGALIGWALWQGLQRHLEEQAYPSPVREPVRPPEDVEEPETPPSEPDPDVQPVSFGKETVADDLTRVEGIGPKVAALLQDVGITTFARLAATEVDTLREILRDANLQFMNPVTWPEQASLAQSGDWDELASLQEALKGGQRA
jgi:predicted flap endonuclease-1-like 5' DNA nuclease